MSIVITGNPGVGKHTITKKISKKLNLPIIDINIIAKDSEAIQKRENTNEVDTQKLANIVKDIKLDDMGDALLIDPSNSQPFVYNGAMGQWNEGSIGINFMPIQVLGDFLVNSANSFVDCGNFHWNVSKFR